MRRGRVTERNWGFNKGWFMPGFGYVDSTEHPRHKYAAFGTAGLIYPGGISGLNDAGFAASLHQMSTTELESGFLAATGDIAPYVQQRMLRECASVDDAIDLAKSTRHFAAWTFFVSDAKTGKAARIEVNGDGVKAVRFEGQAVAQTNHFLHPDWVERHFDEDDAHFTASFGRWLDTHARLDSITAALAADAGSGRIDVDWSIDWLASSRDYTLEENAERKNWIYSNRPKITISGPYRCPQPPAGAFLWIFSKVRELARFSEGWTRACGPGRSGGGHCYSAQPCAAFRNTRPGTPIGASLAWLRRS